ncbi:MAG: hypothetical protein IKU53_03550 [Firmicutes bacterium]|nr:hypothetical protein [Bacillota bacterium]
MKQIIVIIGTILLGILIFNMMVGSGDNSLRSISRDIMEQTIDHYREAGKVI